MIIVHFIDVDNSHFNELLDELVEVIHEKDSIVQQTDMDRIRWKTHIQYYSILSCTLCCCRELEEQEAQDFMFNDQFGEPNIDRNRKASIKSESAIDVNVKKKERRTSWWPW
jgi:hypothetical protein